MLGALMVVCYWEKLGLTEFCVTRGDTKHFMSGTMEMRRRIHRVTPLGRHDSYFFEVGLDI